MKLLDHIDLFRILKWKAVYLLTILDYFHLRNMSPMRDLYRARVNVRQGLTRESDIEFKVPLYIIIVVS